MIDWILWFAAFAANVVLLVVAGVGSMIRLWPLVGFGAYVSCAHVVGFALRNYPAIFHRASELLYLGEAALITWLSCTLLGGFFPKLKGFAVSLCVMLVTLAAIFTFFGLNWPSYYVAGCAVVLSASIALFPVERPAGEEYAFLIYSTLTLIGSQLLTGILVQFLGKTRGLSRFGEAGWIVGIALLIVAVLRFDPKGRYAYE